MSMSMILDAVKVWDALPYGERTYEKAMQVCREIAGTSTLAEPLCSQLLHRRSYIIP